MLSALIPSERSYPAVQLVPKPVHQRFVQPGPLVLGPASLRYLTLTADRDQPVSRMLLLCYQRHGLYHHPRRGGEIGVLAPLIDKELFCSA